MKYNVREGDYRTMGAVVHNDGVVFTFEGRKEQKCSIVLYEKKTGKIGKIPVPDTYYVGALRSIMVMGIEPASFDYNFEIDGKVMTDPYARRIVGREKWGEKERFGMDYQVKSGFSTDVFDWEEDVAPEIAKKDMVMYKLHVRNFTMEGSNGGARKGTFEAVENRIGYLRDMGVTTVEFMPFYEFEELMIPETCELPDYVTWKEEQKTDTKKLPEVEKINCWGYTEGNYFAPKAAFTKSRQPEYALKSLIKALHKNDMECIMEIYFPDTINQNLMLEALRFWVMEYHVDGFRLMGANLPVRAMAQDLILCRSKLFADTIPEDLLEQDYAYPHLFVYRDEFYYPLRKMLNHKEICLTDFVNQMRKQKKYAGFVNYAASNDGFTLADVFMYSEKHNEANGENNADGNDWNYSDNYGIEGPTRKKYIESLRKKQLRNAITAVFLAQGIPLLAAGDEIGNSQRGNNNAYCQDNAVGWVNWKNDKKYASLQQLVKEMIAFRKAHPVLRMEEPMRMNDYKGLGYPDLSFHCDSAWTVGFSPNRQSVGMLYCGLYADCEEMIYVAYNFHTGKQFLALPKLPKSKKWYKVMDTGNENSFLEKEMKMDAVQVEIAGMSIQILIGK